jgi:putative addiction module component (TIGR02574 family)
MKLTDFPDLCLLTLQQKLQLLDELWKDVAPELEDMELGQMEKDLLDERWRKYLEDPSSALDPAEARRTIKSLRE